MWSVNKGRRQSKVQQPFKSPFRSPVPKAENAELSSSSNLTATGTHEDRGKLLNCSEDYLHDRQCSDQKAERHDISQNSALISSPNRYSAVKAPVQVQKMKRRIRSRAGSHQQFKSPFRSSAPSPKASHATQEDLLSELKGQESRLDADIKALTDDGYTVEELQSHIDKLHRYNEIKDVAQMVMGRLANLEQVSLREIHQRYEVPLDEQ